VEHPTHNPFILQSPINHRVQILHTTAQKPSSQAIKAKHTYMIDDDDDDNNDDDRERKPQKKQDIFIFL